MNYSPQNEQSLLDLIGALKGGMDPTTAYGLYQGVQQDQAQRIAQRQERLGGLAELLTGAATQGMPFEGAQALAAAQPGPAGPAVQNMLQSLYPTGGEAPTPAYNANGAQIDGPIGSPAGTQYVPQAGPAAANIMPTATGAGPQATSPAYQPDPATMVAVQGAQNQAAIQQAAQSFAVDASRRASEGMAMQDFLVEMAPLYPELYSTPEGIKQVQQIAMTIFNAPSPATGA